MKNQRAALDGITARHQGHVAVTGINAKDGGPAPGGRACGRAPAGYFESAVFKLNRNVLCGRDRPCEEDRGGTLANFRSIDAARAGRRYSGRWVRRAVRDCSYGPAPGFPVMTRTLDASSCARCFTLVRAGILSYGTPATSVRWGEAISG